jgi:hypothetical protein
MLYGQAAGVEHLTSAEGGQARVAAKKVARSTTVNRISQDRATQSRQVDPSLVGAAGDQGQEQKAKPGFRKMSTKSVKSGGRSPAGADRGHLVAQARMPAYGQIHPAALCPGPAQDKGQVALDSLAAAERAGQPSQGRFGFGGHQHPAGISIQAMDQARAQAGANLRKAGVAGQKPAGQSGAGRP